ncbi:hypothetical protein V6N12_037114 [Hibiscus sabdariffa]|uniref:Uncharacterized protein n=1 Tax=Hibiscus sabdariffa TaxID=183260 RepID=A0ABR2ANY8_9ROSI
MVPTETEPYDVSSSCLSLAEKKTKVRTDFGVKGNEGVKGCGGGKRKSKNVTGLRPPSPMKDCLPINQ